MPLIVRAPDFVSKDDLVKLVTANKAGHTSASSLRSLEVMISKLRRQFSKTDHPLPIRACVTSVTYFTDPKLMLKIKQSQPAQRPRQPAATPHCPKCKFNASTAGPRTYGATFVKPSCKSGTNSYRSCGRCWALFQLDLKWDLTERKKRTSCFGIRRGPGCRTDHKAPA